jgi:post-segregation antitoxin (ccd killing protein)
MKNLGNILYIKTYVSIFMPRKSITMPEGLVERAHSHGLNVSKVCAIAVEAAVQRFEQEPGKPASKGGNNA